MNPGVASVADGTVWHGRFDPVLHEFSQSVSYVWIDPDRPADLVAGHPLWSVRRWTPVSFQRGDYGDDRIAPLGQLAIDDLAPILGHRPLGPVRMLTQVRRFGWLFNPITIFVVWDRDVANPDPTTGTDSAPVGAILEVTNTPWKERHRYPLRLVCKGDMFESVFAKRLHVSPFLESDLGYHLRLSESDGQLTVRIDAKSSTGDTKVATRLEVSLEPAHRAVLARSMRKHALSTLGVSLGIHLQAFRLFLKRVPVVRHPKKRKASQKRREVST